MKIRKAKKEVVVEFQKRIDEFLEKIGSYFKKTITVLGVVGIGASTVLLTGCSEEKPKDDFDQGVFSEKSDLHAVEFANSFEEKEQKFEKVLASYLTESTGRKIELVDMKDVKLVNSSGYYMVISGDFISDVKEGTKECSITLRLTEEQYKVAEKFLESSVYKNLRSGGYTFLIQNENTASLKFSKDFLKGMNDIITSKETIVEAIYDKDNKEWVFEVDEPSVSKKK